MKTSAKIARGAFDTASLGGRARSGWAFTLIELLVVIGIIGLLVGLLVPAVVYGRFRAKVAICTGNFRQWAIASATYATDDGHGRLPSFQLPTASSKLSNYSALEPWFVAIPMITNMGSYGVTARMWFCPTHEERWRNADEFRRFKSGGQGVVTPADLDTYYRLDQKASIAFPDLFWWVPRPLEGSSTLVFPDPKQLRTRIPDPWPTKMEDASAGIQPIASDWLVGTWDDDLKQVTSASLGHSFGGKVRNNNAAFADGHVETRPWSDVKWQMIQGGGAAGYRAYLY